MGFLTTLVALNFARTAKSDAQYNLMSNMQRQHALLNLSSSPLAPLRMDSFHKMDKSFGASKVINSTKVPFYTNLAASLQKLLDKQIKEIAPKF